jgi:hypothetical protein
MQTVLNGGVQAAARRPLSSPCPRIRGLLPRNDTAASIDFTTGPISATATTANAGALVDCYSRREARHGRDKEEQGWKAREGKEGVGDDKMAQRR